MDNNTLRDYLKVIFKHKIVIFASIIVIIALTSFKVYFLTPYYTASVRMLVKGQMMAETDYYKQIGSFNIPVNHAMLVKSKSVLERVVKVLKLYDRPLDFGEKQLASRIRKYYIDREIERIKLQLQEMTNEQRRGFLIDYAVGRLASSVEAEKLERSDLLELTVRDYDPALAAIIANSISRSYLIFDLEQQIAELKLKYGDKNSTVIKLKNYIQELYKTLDGKPLSATEAFGAASVKVISQARRSGMLEKPVQAKTVMAMAFLASIIFGITIAFAIELLDQTLKSPQDIQKILNIPFLGSIPERKYRDKLLIKDNNPSNTNYSEAYQKLSSHIRLIMKNKNFTSLIITDAEGRKDSAAVIANLCHYLTAKTGLKVLMIDFNFRTPFLSEFFNLSKSPGISDVIEGRLSFEESIRSLDNNLSIIPAGDTNHNEAALLNSSTISDVISEAKKKFEMVFINSADIKNFTDAETLSSFVDSVILVINEGKVRRQVVKNAISQLTQEDSKIIGAILNNRTYALPGIIYKLT